MDKEKPVDRGAVTILVVDDEEVVVKIIVAWLNKLDNEHNFVIHTARSAEEALSVMNSFDIDFLITDISMSGMSGIDLLGKVKVFYPEMQSVIVTGYGERDNILAALKLGVFDFLLKPLGFAEFADVVERCVGRIDQAREERREWSGEREYQSATHEKREREYQFFRAVLDDDKDALAIFDRQGRLLYANPAYERQFCRSVKKYKRLGDFFPPETIRLLENEIIPSLSFGGTWHGELEAYDEKHTPFRLQGWIAAIRDGDGEMFFRFSSLANIATMPPPSDAEVRIEVQGEYDSIRQDLLEASSTVTFLLKKMEMDKQELLENISANFNSLILPYYEKLKLTALNEQQRKYLNIIARNLEDIVSPFARSLTIKGSNLTPTELKVANLVMHGMASKEVADIMNLSPLTVKIHRKQIRKKLGIGGTKENLYSFLVNCAGKPNGP